MKKNCTVLPEYGWKIGYKDLAQLKEVVIHRIYQRRLYIYYVLLYSTKSDSWT
jgi:hypothetical protein